ncbi:KH homology domain-containing protein 4-like isoform X3 [Hoplias malabaricus]|uniref:KH homology domain-containing protein 4-like isoform X3 n=1 Tax=Hoplias malabaricus TaxID=27720 RepID=UPI003461F354
MELHYLRCLNSRWDQPKSKTNVLQGILGNMTHALSPQGESVQAGTAGTQPSAGGSTAAPGGVEMAAAMAAKINAMLLAKGKLKPLQPLPSKAPTCTPQSVSSEEVLVTEVDINDVPVNCRNLLTNSKTQEEIRQYSGAVVSTKGLYISDSDKSNTAVDRPLYLHVQGHTQDEVNKAVMRIKEIISEDVLRACGGQQPAVMPPVPVYPQPPRPAAALQTPRPHLPPQTQSSTRTNTPVTPAHRPPPPHSGSFVHTKIFVGLEQCVEGFNVNEKVEGPNGSYLQHIQSETGARVFLRGKGSGYIEQASRRESFEPLYLYISHPNSTGLESAKKLCESLLETVRAEHSRMLSAYTATGSTQAYPTGYSSNSSYSAQSWYGYPTNGYSSAYPSYPVAAGYWNGASGPSTHTPITTNTPSQTQTHISPGMVQYPVCPRQPPAFVLEVIQGEGSATNSSSSPAESRSPKRHFIEDSEEAEEIKLADPVKETEGSPKDDSGTDMVLMPPPPAPVPSAVRKRPRETEQSSIKCTSSEKYSHDLGDDDNNNDDDDDDNVDVKKVKVDTSGLVPYGGDSSDEEEERTRNVRKNNT